MNNIIILSLLLNLSTVIKSVTAINKAKSYNTIKDRIYKNIRRFNDITYISSKLSKNTCSSSCSVGDLIFKLYCDPKSGINENCNICNGIVYYSKRVNSIEQQCCLLGILKDGKCHTNSYLDKTGKICNRKYNSLVNGYCKFNKRLFVKENLIWFIAYYLCLISIPFLLNYCLFTRR